MTKLFSDLRDFLFPRWCLTCGKKLLPSEESVCITCLAELPRTNLKDIPGNRMEQLFWGIIPIERASALYLYAKGSKVAQILYAMKYHGRKDVCRQMGTLSAEELLKTDFFAHIDALIPVPLHPKRLRERGYNQSEWFARGISEKTGIPIYNNVLRRVRNNLTQTHKSSYERRENAESLFATTPEADRISGKHLLLTDDVLTTGATLTACAEALLGIKGVRISILTLAWAKYNAI